MLRLFLVGLISCAFTQLVWAQTLPGGPTSPAQNAIVPDQDGKPVGAPGVDGKPLNPAPVTQTGNETSAKKESGSDGAGSSGDGGQNTDVKSQDRIPEGIETANQEERAIPTSQLNEVVSNSSPKDAKTKDYKDWRLECYDPSVSGVRCQILQQVINRQASQPIMVFSLAYVPLQQHTELQMAVPLGFQLSKGISITIGDYATVLSASRCVNRGCWVDGIAAQSLLSAMINGSTGEVVLNVAKGQDFKIPLSLSGFGAAFTAMTQNNNAAAKAVGN